MPRAFTESIVEAAALAWLEGLGYIVAHGPDLAPGGSAAERADFGQVVLVERLRRGLARLIKGGLRVPDAERVVGRVVRCLQ